MRNHLSLTIIALCLPFILWAVCAIEPTFDDFTTLQSPWWVQIADPGYFHPDAIRRPWDFLFGCLLGYYPPLFPTLNHVCIILGHAASALLVFRLCRWFSLGTLATNTATLLFFFSPATLGATLACDGLNQTYAQLWGLLSLCCYLDKRYRLWLLCVVMAALSKENGLAWAVVAPIVAWGFQQEERREALRHIGHGLLVALAYFVVFFTITYCGIFDIHYDEQYAEVTLVSHLKDFMQMVAYNWVPLDYMSAVYPPTRNWTVVAITALMSLPFLLLLATGWRQLKTRRLLVLIACFFVLASPHLVTLVSIMHNYAPLAMTALSTAIIISHGTDKGTLRPKTVIAGFALFMAAALFTDVRHYQAARQAGLVGRQMAMQVIEQSATPPQRAFCINIDDEAMPRYSNFCVRPVDAFGWGLSVRHYSHYTWKTAITDVSLPSFDRQRVQHMADSALHAGNDAVWLVGHDADKVTIIMSAFPLCAE